MSDRARVRSVGSSLALALGLVFAPTRAAIAEDKTITEVEVVEAAIAKNPDLKAAVIDVKSAEWTVVYEDDRYPYTLGLTTGFTHSAIPFAADDNAVSASFSNGVDVGAYLTKHLVWGTDLTLSVDGSWDLGSAPSAATTATAGSTASAEVPIYGIAAKLAVVQPLLRGAGREVGEASLYQARAQKSSAEATRDRAASDLLKSVVNAYWELWYANESVSIEKSSLDLLTRERDDAKKRVDTGGIAPADLLTFESKLASEEEAYTSAELDRKQKSANLLAQLGSAGGASSLVPSGEPVTPAPPPSDAQDRAEKASPQIAEAKRAISLAEIQQRTAADATRPRLDLDGYVQTQGLGNGDAAQALGQFGKLGAVSAHVGLTFEAPLTGSQHRAADARAGLAVESAKARLESTRQSVIASVASEVLREASARRRVELAETSVRIAQQALDAESARLGTGSSTPLNVLEAESDLRSAKLRLVRARVDLIEADIDLDHLMGRLIARYGVKVEKIQARSRAVRAAQWAGPITAPHSLY